MDLTLLSKNLIEERFGSMPQNLRNAIESEDLTTTIKRICIARNLKEDDERVEIIIQLAGLILLGFLSRDDFAREIEANTHLNYRLSAAIAGEIDQEIFDPIQIDLKKFYNPIKEPQSEELPVSLQPIPTAPSEPAVPPVPQSAAPTPAVGGTPTITQVVPPPPPPKMPAPSIKIAAEPASSAKKEELPFMLHKETELTQIPETKKFESKVPIAARPAAPPPVQARIELGGLENAEPKLEGNTINLKGL